MIKALFIDYTGTIVMEGGPEMKEAVMRICKNSSLRDPQKMMKVWWSIIKHYEECSYGVTYLTEDEILDKAFGILLNEYHLQENIDELKELVRGFWVNAPIFADVKDFFKTCPIPLYVITNNGIQYVSSAMNRNDLHPAGIVCADMVRAYKPHRELFEKALEISGCSADEVMHIGDSYISDVPGAREAGITPVLIQRDVTSTCPDDCIVIHSLEEVYQYIECYDK